jgi:membrane carboxypeptidase/penicillin-binding protein PbpC
MFSNGFQLLVRQQLILGEKTYYGDYRPRQYIEFASILSLSSIIALNLNFPFIQVGQG